MKDTRQSTSRQYTIYIIEIMPRWHYLVAPDLPPGKRCFYVGQTSHNVSERYREHLTGKSKPGRRKKATVRALKPIFKSKDGEPLERKVDVTLRRNMMAAYPTTTDQEEANDLEAKAVEDLRLEGHCVYPEGLGETDFAAYREATAP